MNELPHPASLGSLVRSVAVLALPFEDQVAWLSSLGLGDADYVDELALELGAAAMLLDQFERAGWIKPGTARAIREIDSLLADWSGPANSERWTVDALRVSPDWARVRVMSRGSLFEL